MLFMISQQPFAWMKAMHSTFLYYISRSFNYSVHDINLFLGIPRGTFVCTLFRYYCNRGIVLRKSNRPAEAIKDFESAIKVYNQCASSKCIHTYIHTYIYIYIHESIHLNTKRYSSFFHSFLPLSYSHAVYLNHV